MLIIGRRSVLIDILDDYKRIRAYEKPKNNQTISQGSRKAHTMAGVPAKVCQDVREVHAQTPNDHTQQVQKRPEMTAKRIQRKRTKGWLMPEGAVYVGRPTRWGNIYSIENCGSGERAAKF